MEPLKILSCYSCGVLLDANRLFFISRYILDNDGNDVRLNDVNGDDLMTTCPVCGEFITEQGEL